MNSFVLGMQDALKYKAYLVKIVTDVYGKDFLENHEIVFEGIDKVGRSINITITEPKFSEAYSRRF